MRKVLYVVLVLFSSCSVRDERCGEIIQKIELNGAYYFVLQTDDYGQQINSDTYIPDDGVRQGAVAASTYKAYQVGDQYCAEN